MCSMQHVSCRYTHFWWSHSERPASTPTSFIGTVARSTTCETDCSLAPKMDFPILNWRLTDLVVKTTGSLNHHSWGNSNCCLYCHSHLPGIFQHRENQENVACIHCKNSPASNAQPFIGTQNLLCIAVQWAYTACPAPKMSVYQESTAILNSGKIT